MYCHLILINVNRYKDKEAFGIHGQSDQMKSFQKKLQGEELLGAPLVLKFTKNAGGFTSRI